MGHKPSAAAQQRSNVDAVPNPDEVQERAYFRYLERGRTDGNALDDSLVADTEIGQKAGSQADS